MKANHLTQKNNPFLISFLHLPIAPRRQVDKVLHRGQSKFQKVEVVKTKPFGRLLITDGLMQSSEDDEYVYHQSLVHPALTAHPNPKKVFIAGGGEVRVKPISQIESNAKKPSTRFFVFSFFPFRFSPRRRRRRRRLFLDDAARICMLCFSLSCSFVWGDEML